MAKFKARARTLDMLGRQQIAGIPTAISELFKNAHDAYADRVEVDYYRSDGLFVLRDDGFGMTKEDFKERWLTLGTESKMDSGKGLSPPQRDSKKRERPILGEKGIGRLAIASIGPQVLVLTRAERDGELRELVAAFINWGLFELPGIDLDQIIVPLRTFIGDNLPGKDEINNMVNEVMSNVKDLTESGMITSNDADILLKQMSTFNLDPKEIDDYLKNQCLLVDGEEKELSLSKNGHGTHFFILPAYELLQTEIEGDSYSKKAPNLTKMLIGFTNTMTPNNQPVNIKTSFRDHKSDDYCIDIITDSDFFTPEEFEMADHHFKGCFDDYGQFQGVVSVYGEKSIKHIVPWTGAKGRKTLCGPFSINVAYIQGKFSQTKIPPLEHSLIMNKLDRLGGLYLYKDGIRILPYGDSDYDFLEIEKRRTKSASYYYFSYRRMFGAINITRNINKKLIEKAGREGFIENKAYKQFKEILINYFLQLAVDFFRKTEQGGGPNTEIWLKRRTELEKQHKAKKKREKMARVRKNEFGKKLDEFFKRIQNGTPNKEVLEIIETAEKEFDGLINLDELEEASKQFIISESKARKQLLKVKKKYMISKPRGFAIGKLRFDWEAYQNEMTNLNSKLFNPALNTLNEMANSIKKSAHFHVDNRLRFENALTETIRESRNITKNSTKTVELLLDEVRENARNLTQSLLSDLEEDIKWIMSETGKINITKMTDLEIVDTRTKFETRLISDAEKNEEILDSFQNQLENVLDLLNETDEIITTADMTEAIEEELLILRERADLDLELSQLGLAIGVIHHEFSSTVKAIRDNIRTLKAWADANDALTPIYGNISSNFEHLDGYLTLFTPLNKRLYRKEIDITGNEIYKFVRAIFEVRMKRHNVSLKATRAFQQKIIRGYPSTFYPVFVNLIDNALFWLRDQTVSKKIILDADENGFSVSNNGPEISIRDRNVIFEFGFSRKPAGRGMGLFISREVLTKVGFEIFNSDPVDGMGVTFRIEPEKEQIKG